MVIDPADARYADQGPLDRQQTANLARRANDVGLIAITTIDLNSTADRSELQQTLGDDLHTVHVATPETRCAEWDDHGRYPEVSGQFQAPGKSLIEVNLAESELESAIQSIVEALVAQKILTE